MTRAVFLLFWAAACTIEGMPRHAYDWECLQTCDGRTVSIEFEACDLASVMSQGLTRVLDNCYANAALQGCSEGACDCRYVLREETGDCDAEP